MSRLSDHVRDTIAAERLSFHMPAHKGGAGAPPAGIELFGSAAYAVDLSELGGFDYLHGAETGIAQAQERAAALLGADRTWFLVNGSTVGNIAALAATARDGDGVLMARASHRSVYAGVVTAGARPVYLPAVQNDALDGLFGIRVDDVRAALAADPTIRAVHVTTPSFYGFTIPLAALAQVTAEHGVPLLVDEAHGAHWRFHERFPTPALDAGADIAVQSPHKTLGSFTQSALMHVRGDLVSHARVDAALQMLQSSSPSSLLTVSIDVALEAMAEHGTVQWAHAIELADMVRADVGQDGPVRIYGDEIVGMPGIDGYDPIKLVVDVHGLGTTGHAAARWLKAEHGVNPEFADLRRMVFSVTTADTRESCAALVAALHDLASAPLEQDASGPVTSRWPSETPEQAYTPRVALQRDALDVPLADAIGKVSAEMVVPYPPGIPLLVPGEVVSAAVVETIEQVIAAGSPLVGVADPKATSLRCLSAD